jgi:hypothetical protein
MQSGDCSAQVAAGRFEGVVMSVFEAVELELEEMGARVAGSALAATALALAAELDAGNSATSKSMCAKALVDVLREVRALAPPRKETDGVDDLATRRAERRAAAAAVARS